MPDERTFTQTQEGSNDLEKVGERLGIEPDRASLILRAARSIPEYEDYSAEHIGDTLHSDFNARAKVEQAAMEMEPDAFTLRRVEPATTYRRRVRIAEEREPMKHTIKRGSPAIPEEREPMKHTIKPASKPFKPGPEE